MLWRLTLSDPLQSHVQVFVFVIELGFGMKRVNGLKYTRPGEIQMSWCSLSSHCAVYMG